MKSAILIKQLFYQVAAIYCTYCSNNFDHIQNDLSAFANGALLFAKQALWIDARGKNSLRLMSGLTLWRYDQQGQATVSERWMIPGVRYNGEVFH